MTDTPALPVHAATVVPLRDHGGRLELFMVKRHKKSAFMASAYVYPGGKLDEADTAEATAACCQGLTAAAAAEAMAPAGPRPEGDAPLSQAEALGLYVAAVREVFEESGLLLATGPDGQTLSFDDPEVAARFNAWRRQLHAGALSMTELAAREGLRYQLGDLRYFAHWITPVIEPRRFNTRFFLTRAPEGQQPAHDERETVASAWMGPGAALDAYNRGEIQLAPPTLRTLEDIAAFDSVDAALDGLGASPVVTILPRFETLDGALTLLLPGDPCYPSTSAVTGPTRVVMDQGRWWSRGG